MLNLFQDLLFQGLNVSGSIISGSPLFQDLLRFRLPFISGSIFSWFIIIRHPELTITEGYGHAELVSVSLISAFIIVRHPELVSGSPLFSIPKTPKSK